MHLWSHDWPGNVRELENMIARLAIMCEGDVIDTDVLPEDLRVASSYHKSLIPQRLPPEGTNLNAIVRELEGRFINDALRQTDGNKQAAARLLGLKRTTFAAKLRRSGVVLPTPPRVAPLNGRLHE